MEQLESGKIDWVPKEDAATQVSYLAHQHVVLEQAETNKVRVVHYAFYKDRTTKASLNDCLYVCPALYPLMQRCQTQIHREPKLSSKVKAWARFNIY